MNTDVAEKTLEVPKFANNEEAAKFWRSNARCHNVSNGVGRYALTRKEAQDAYHQGRADLVERKESGDKVKAPEVYRAFKVRNEYEACRADVRKLNVDLHSWINHTGTKA